MGRDGCTVLSEREQQLLRALLESAGPLSARALASRLDVSIRTVKACVQKINAKVPGCIGSNRSGYHPDPDLASALIDAQRSDDVPQNSRERIVFLLRRLLFANRSLNVFDLCEELFVSLTTMKTDLSRVRHRIAPFRLDLVQHDNQLSLEGLEKDKRRLGSDLLYSETSVNFLDLSTIEQAFPDIDAGYISACVRETLDEYRRFANDYSVVNLVLHIAITIERIRSGNSLSGMRWIEDDRSVADAGSVGSRDPESSGAGDRELALAITGRLAEHFGIAFSSVEVYELSLLLASRTTLLDYRTATKDDIEHFIGSECLALVREMISDLSGYYGIDLSEHEFFVRFALHIKNLLLRAKSGGLSKNPLTQQIRSMCPLLYDTAVAEACLIKMRTALEINDDEIAYIAFHLGSALETQKQLTNKVKAVLYCPSYYDLDKKVMLFLDRHFEAVLLITNIVTEEEDLAHLSAVDLLIATVPVKVYSGAPIYRVNIFPTDHDAEEIRRIVEELKHRKRRGEIRGNLERLMFAELFEINEDRMTRDEVIHRMVNRLRARDWVGEDFEERVWEREALSSTSLSSFALPHPVRLCSKRSSISVMVSHTPIDWNGEYVRLVMMLSFNRRDRAAFYELFDPLVCVLSDPQQVLALSRCENYEEFISRLCDMME
ncbi:BglG family transcription antiterminator [Coriobacterium glomerans]|uniref:BglG family transcription antiterminator n=1 Tax=Coriobacterium glomerans TaxID=33871 RepID=UPI0005A246C4|nr:PTS sugar transporter subunit IIA [Coriobacterium glomerans]